MSEVTERSPWMLAEEAEAEPLLLALATASALDTELPKGTDVSFHQKFIDWWEAWADGVRFAYIRWGQREAWGDGRAEENWQNCNKTPILRGAYWVWDERGGDLAAEHRKGVLAVAAQLGLSDYDGELPLVADLELEPVSWNELHEWLLWLEAWLGRKPDIYTGSWFYSRVRPIPEWLGEYNHWLTGYNNQGPSIWGPLADLDPFVYCWQQANNWQVSWAENGAVDRDFWWAGAEHLERYAQMAEKVVKVDDLRKWINSNQFDAIEVPDGPGPGPGGPFKLQWPTPAPKVVTQWYGINGQFYPGQKGHEGLDMRAGMGVPIAAAAAGEVYRVEKDPKSGPYGIHVRVKHEHPSGTYKTIYAHLERADVDEGDHVEVGKRVGLADDTGNSRGSHLHLTLKKEGNGSDWLNLADIVNPVPYLPDLFPVCRTLGCTGQGWLVDVGGNFRTAPNLGNNVIRFIGAGQLLTATGLFTGDWWEMQHGGETGWFWNPGYKLMAL